MKYAYVGNSGLQVSKITLGCWLTYGKSVEDNIANDIIEKAISLGINSFDCADVYEQGAAEIVLGETLNKYERSDFVVATKVFFPMSENVNNRGLSRKHIMESIDKSLSRLKMDYVDIYYAHRFDEMTPLEETLSAFNDVVKQGKALYIGVSMWNDQQTKEAFSIIEKRGFDKIIVNQPPYNLINRAIENKDMREHYQLGVSQMVYSPLAQGILSGKYNDGIPKNSRRANESIAGFMTKDFEANVNAAKQYQVLADELKISLTHLSLAWILSHKEVASCIVGASSVEQLEENVNSIDIKLSQDTISKIDAIYHNKKLSD